MSHDTDNSVQSYGDAAALAAIDRGPEGAQQLKQIAAAHVEALEAAAVAADWRKQERLAAEAAEAALMARAALNAAVHEVAQRQLHGTPHSGNWLHRPINRRRPRGSSRASPGPPTVHRKVAVARPWRFREPRSALAGSVFFSGEPMLMNRMPATID